MKTSLFPARSFSLFVVLVVCFIPGLTQAKGDGQNLIVLLNDAASALEDTDPALSKSVTQFADEKQKEWEAQNAGKGQPKQLEGVHLKERLDLLKKAALGLEATYPLIARGLDQMAQDLAVHGVTVGMTQETFLQVYPKDDLRNLRHEDSRVWLTYNVPLDDPFHDVITFYFENEKLVSWKLNDRPEVVKEYLAEFCFYQDPDVIYRATREVLLRMPYKDFLNVTNRRRPAIFTEFYNEGTARFASSSEFILTKDDPPCCKEGFTIVKLGMGLGLAKTPGPVEGVVAHELAHRVLDSIRKGNVNCDAERAANRLIQKWGFKEEFKEASQLFGQRKGDPAGCQETKKR